MTITVDSVVLALAIVSLGFATFGKGTLFGFWQTLAGGMLLWAISLFLSVNV